jgi:hypothetical protein
MEDLKPTDWVNAKERFKVEPRPEPSIDKQVSDIVGKEIRVNNPQLIKLIVKYKKLANKPENSLEPDNYFNNPDFIKELKETL